MLDRRVSFIIPAFHFHQNKLIIMFYNPQTNTINSENEGIYKWIGKNEYLYEDFESSYEDDEETVIPALYLARFFAALVAKFGDDIVSLVLGGTTSSISTASSSTSASSSSSSSSK